MEESRKKREEERRGEKRRREERRREEMIYKNNKTEFTYLPAFCGTCTKIFINKLMPLSHLKYKSQKRGEI
jgi:hypothetical protein